MLFQPFFINSNIITNKSSLISYDSFLTAIAGNTGNSYITYALLKELGISELKDEFHIQNIYETHLKEFHIQNIYEQQIL